MPAHLNSRFRVNARLHAAANTAATLLFPRRCPVCDEPVRPWNALICKECAPKLTYIRPPYCFKCGKHIGDSGKEYCDDCAAHPHLFDSGRALFSYRSVSASIARFKYQGRREYAAYYASCIQRQFGDFIRSCRADALVPVPLHKSRYKKRGYNQAQALAEELSARTGIPMRADLIERAEKTAPMKDLSAAERQNNLKKAFKILRNDVELGIIIIIDDIYTTGSTIDAMSRELRKAGVERIYFITLAIG
ncbi:MAG: double zinc ribbon domain-containing protein, partial [Lachnospiraceae bacterium]|nr:double zinc ribbon domain-containing protein [Lachnospiraceae bacterium]